MMNNRIYICTFAMLPRGSGQRRGTTCERLEVDMGRLLIACRFDLGRRRRDLRRPTFFLCGSKLFLGFSSGCVSDSLR